MYCRPPLVKSMSRSSLTGQSQVYNTGDEEEDRSHSSTVAQLRRDSESIYKFRFKRLKKKNYYANSNFFFVNICNNAMCIPFSCHLFKI